jgi:phage shock protein PspC (stress-responsive transcriptional regulator)
MKKTVMINLWGQVFHIDEDAYETLQHYITRIEQRFSGSEEGKEIVEDVESRIAELFKERLGTDRQVVNMDDVNYTIGIIGTPEDFDAPESGTNEDKESKKQKGHSKRLYRDPDNRILGGVGGGLAAYFKIDPAIVRIILILTFFISGPLIYIVLWIVLPEAVTTAQKLEMSGESVNLSNIEKKIKDEFGKVKDSIKSKNTKQQIRNSAKSLSDVIFDTFHVFFRIFLTVLGISFLLLGITMLIAIFVGLLFDAGNNINVFQVLGKLFESDIAILAMIGLNLLLIVPVISLIFAGIRLMFGVRFSFKILHKTLLGFFICGLILTGIVVFDGITNFRYKGQTNEIIPLDSLAKKTIVLAPGINSINENESEYFMDSEKWLINLNDDKDIVYGKPSISIQKSKTEVPSISIMRFCRCGNKKDGATFTRNLSSVVTMTDSIATISEYFPISTDKIFRFQEQRVTVFLPVGSKIFIQKGMDELLDDVLMPWNYSYSDLSGKTWIMTENGLDSIPK